MKAVSLLPLPGLGGLIRKDAAKRPKYSPAGLRRRHQEGCFLLAATHGRKTTTGSRASSSSTSGELLGNPIFS